MFPHQQRMIDVTNYSFFGDIRNAIKIAFVSDLHEYKAEPVIEIIKQNSPEIILLGGDIVHNTQQYERGIELFAATATLCPTYCCLGNHEQVFKDDIIPLIAKTGVIPLDNAAVQYKDINIGGLSSPVRKIYLEDECEIKDDIVEKKPDIAWLYEYERLKGYKLLLATNQSFITSILEKLPLIWFYQVMRTAVSGVLETKVSLLQGKVFFQNIRLEYTKIV